MILTARKLETGPLENYTHMATLIHKINLLLLEFDNIPQLRNTLKLIYSQKLLNTINDFVMNTESFANFGIRFLEILSLQFAEEVIQSEILGIVTGLLRTNDYETVAQCLSFVSVLAENANLIDAQSKYFANTKLKHSHEKPKTISVKDVLSKRLLILVMKTVQKSPEVEFLHFST